ncbi:hypothetical protein DERF_002540 [Dermatophagoides farinae]|uniref:Uncharacterized protein n=1 Tax=Dermatophagoides farinae TaxID=6954 RepID=A0A922IFV1_DERFA|nr:hypothetical protein DERF_002540 [Dermatophagoides farinae]
MKYDNEQQANNQLFFPCRPVLCLFLQHEHFFFLKLFIDKLGKKNNTKLAILIALHSHSHYLLVSLFHSFLFLVFDSQEKIIITNDIIPFNHHHHHHHINNVSTRIKEFDIRNRIE